MQQNECVDLGTHQAKWYTCLIVSLSDYYIVHRLLTTDFADEIPAPVTVLELNHTSSSAKILWPEPIDPNGLVIKYQIEYRRTDIPNVSSFALFIQTKHLMVQFSQSQRRKESASAGKNTRTTT